MWDDCTEYYIYDERRDAGFVGNPLKDLKDPERFISCMKYIEKPTYGRKLNFFCSFFGRFKILYYARR